MNKMTTTTMLVIMFFTYTLQAQIPGYVQGDENYTITLAFHKVDTWFDPLFFGQNSKKGLGHFYCHSG
ncbi:MAG: hypothetical protein JG775_2747 [Defluviitaleaceae bacterium]|jgi:hypothetical protein|nr:hypothetical protein [Defluviitaleaceae bacterium]MDK2904922.1 hypothetical protein [Eubacteriaceae bacterium]